MPLDPIILAHPLLATIVAGFAGMIAHWFKRWGLDQTTMGLVEFFKANKRGFVVSAASLLGGIATTIGTGFTTVSYESLALAFTVGFSLNSVFSPHDSN